MGALVREEGDGLHKLERFSMAPGTSHPGRQWTNCLRFTIALLLLPAVSWAQVCRSGAEGFAPVAYQEYLVDATTVVSINLSVLPPAATNLGMALVTVEGANVRYTYVGIPTATSGHSLEPPGNLYLCGRTMLEGFRMIRDAQGAQNAMVRITIFNSP
jgi:hypothetical protein